MNNVQRANPEGYMELALMFARTCNIACRHCGIESSPQNKSRMTLDEARGYILDAACIPKFRKITFTGGEPFLFQPEHIDLLELCSGLGLSTRMVTNGFWAADMEKGRQVLGRMKAAGLTELNFSADKFHLEFQDAQILKNAIELARELGFSRIISFVTNEPEPPLDIFSRMYGIPRDQLMDLRSVARDRDRMEQLKDQYIFVYAGGLIGMGRAAQYPAELKYVPWDFFPDMEACGEVVNKPVIYPDGDFQACCCAGGKVQPFTVGNAKREPLRDLFERMRSRSHYRFINSHGPKELFRIISEARPDIRRPETFTSICELCVRACDGLVAAEIDTIVDNALLTRTLAALGFTEPATVPVPTATSQGA
jgi:MoaA/NifB/PqqE/SkfB family radical SAM enzyme